MLSGNYTPLDAVCCRANIARCKACEQGISVEKYCKANPSAFGCESLPAAQPMFDRDGWTPIESLLSTDSAERQRKINAMASATTEQELDVAIAEARAYGVSHLVIRQQQRRLNSMRGDGPDISGGYSHTSVSLASSSHSHTGRNCSHLSHIHKRACDYGYRSVKLYCINEGSGDSDCEIYVDSDVDRRKQQWNDLDDPSPPPSPSPPPADPPADLYTYESTIMVGIGFLLIITGFIAYQFYKPKRNRRNG